MTDFKAAITQRCTAALERNAERRATGGKVGGVGQDGETRVGTETETEAGREGGEDEEERGPTCTPVAPTEGEVCAFDGSVWCTR